MKNFFYLAITLCIATGLIFVSCDKANNDDLNGSLNFNSTASSLSDNFGRANDIPAEYDSIDAEFGNYLTTVSLALIDKGIENPTTDDIKHEAKKYYREKYADFDTTMIDNFDESAISTDNSFLSDDQQKTLDKLNELIISTDKDLFEQQIPTMVSLINTLPASDRASLFIYLATIKHGAIADRNISIAIADGNRFVTSGETMVTQGFWRWLGNAFCGAWYLGRYAAIITPGAAAVPFIDGACLAYGLSQLV
ncbi:MAG: hypothetical protein LBK94_05485 [Prevotellaceae bacterium]|jgi:hypothetical protein|nr:hypothetical protein [Prevotellaceae bacterium]